jgi:hypothetical protein
MGDYYIGAVNHFINTGDYYIGADDQHRQRPLDDGDFAGLGFLSFADSIQLPLYALVGGNELRSRLLNGLAHGAGNLRQLLLD